MNNKSLEQIKNEREAERIVTKTVQLWTNSGVMITAQLTNEEAKKMVREGKAFVITGQAIQFS